MSPRVVYLSSSISAQKIYSREYNIHSRHPSMAGRSDHYRMPSGQKHLTLTIGSFVPIASACKTDQRYSHMPDCISVITLARNKQQQEPSKEFFRCKCTRQDIIRKKKTERDKRTIFCFNFFHLL